MLNDPIADMLTRIRNAVAQKHRYVDVRKSKMILSILDVFKDTGFVLDFVSNDETGFVRVFLKYDQNREGIINELIRVSKPGRRIYVKWPEVPIIRRGLGLSIVSTSKGVMDGKKAKTEKVGGELICTVW